MKSYKHILAISLAVPFCSLAQEPKVQNPGPQPLTTGATPQDAGAAAQAAAAAAAAAQNGSTGYFVAGGRVYQIRDGRATLLERDFFLRITQRGIFGADGQPIIVPQGQMMTADGRFVPMPASVTGLPVVNPGGTTSRSVETTTSRRIGPAVVPDDSPAPPPTSLDAVPAGTATPGVTRPGTSPGTGTQPGTSPGTGIAPESSPGTGTPTAPNGTPGIRVIPPTSPGPTPGTPPTL
jgi:hypothetical protein